MTEPDDMHQDPGADRRDPVPSGDELDRLRSRLRSTEAVDVDQASRERRLRTALAAFDEPVAPVVPLPRRGAPRRWLVAAAILAVLGVGGYVAVSLGGPSNGDAESTALAQDGPSADAGAAQMAPPSTVVTSPPAAASERSDQSGGSTDQGAASDATPFDPSVIELGSFVDPESLVAALGAGTDHSTARLDRVASAELTPCVEQQRALGVEVAGIAQIGGVRVVVIRTGSELTVLDGISCVAIGP